MTHSLLSGSLVLRYPKNVSYVEVCVFFSEPLANELFMLVHFPDIKLIRDVGPPPPQIFSLLYSISPTKYEFSTLPLVLIPAIIAHLLLYWELLIIVACA